MRNFNLEKQLHNKNIDETIFSHLNILDIKLMSQNGMQILNTRAVEKIFKNIKKLSNVESL